MSIDREVACNIIWSCLLVDGHVVVLSQARDAFCDALHLDGATLAVAKVVNPYTGANRVIIPGPITVTMNNNLQIAPQ